MSACDISPLLFTQGLVCGQAANFPSRSCFRHKHTEAVILPALKRLRQPHPCITPQCRVKFSLAVKEARPYCRAANGWRKRSASHGVLLTLENEMNRRWTRIHADNQRVVWTRELTHRVRVRFRISLLTSMSICVYLRFIFLLSLPHWPGGQKCPPSRGNDPPGRSRQVAIRG